MQTLRARNSDTAFPRLRQGIILAIVVLALWVLNLAPTTPSRAWAQLAAGQAAPPFALDDLEGRRHELADARGHDIVILYFCDLESGSNRKGLSRLSAILEAHREKRVQALAITSSPVERARAFTNEIPVSFPLLADTASVIDQYHASQVLPTVYILSGDLQVSKVVQGGGRSMEIQIEQALEEARPGGAREQPSRLDPSRDERAMRGAEEDRRVETPRTPTMPPPPIRKTVEKAEVKARRLFQLAREENLKLKWDECLASKALQRARALIQDGAFEHKDPESGKNPAFEMVKSCEPRAAYAGENLSRGMEMASRSIHQELMASSTHRRNIQNPRFSKMGAGCYETICVELFVGF
ncbi:MAG: redoxin domain-containing protein [Syntrophobacteraceae bacterium]|jgi:peroxiredoxin|nr:redoxin domain-containing protein [Syntrophobacteraceae bacterium]